MEKRTIIASLCVIPLIGKGINNMLTYDQRKENLKKAHKNGYYVNTRQPLTDFIIDKIKSK